MLQADHIDHHTHHGRVINYAARREDSKNIMPPSMKIFYVVLSLSFPRYSAQSGEAAATVFPVDLERHCNVDRLCLN